MEKAVVHLEINVRVAVFRFIQYKLNPLILALIVGVGFRQGINLLFVTVKRAYRELTSYPFFLYFLPV